MITALSPFSGHLEDVRNTLKYANRAKNIKMEQTKNILQIKTDLKDYVNIIQQLKTEI